MMADKRSLEARWDRCNDGYLQFGAGCDNSYEQARAKSQSVNESINALWRQIGGDTTWDESRVCVC